MFLIWVKYICCIPLCQGKIWGHFKGQVSLHPPWVKISCKISLIHHDFHYLMLIHQMNLLSFQFNNNPNACLTGGVYIPRKKIPIELPKLDSKEVYEFSDIRRILPIASYIPNALQSNLVKQYLYITSLLQKDHFWISLSDMLFSNKIQVP